ncbi:hypothetical protein GII30_20520 [Gordonia amarae]|uniref:Uncharacterized protein n=3 Tax=Gordonia amarae TaxID=36821 RepID=G7GSW6_9ACTN|nr:hypothetical protein [Gordonia amarae]MCS3880833.1 hypothetical protein [Gordonia amarae]QHN41232.1 hypothetical protein GII30_20520 [Gordonia amarae]GAB06691.1 hypothetical protein GOAMR_58_00670 [Gordonia amarae NBRC 15530]
MTDTKSTHDSTKDSTEASTDATTNDERVTTPNGAENSAESTSDASGESDAGKDESDAGKDGSKQPSKYRQRLAAAESERDRLQAVVAGMHEREVSRICDAAGLNRKLLTAVGVGVDDLLGEDGMVDAGKVDAAIKQARDEFGIDQTRAPFAAPTQ